MVIRFSFCLAYVLSFGTIDTEGKNNNLDKYVLISSEGYCANNNSGNGSRFSML